MRPAQSEYSHTDYGILGLVVERAAGEPFGQFLEREIFAPMTMARTVVHDGRLCSRRVEVTLAHPARYGR